MNKPNPDTMNIPTRLQFIENELSLLASLGKYFSNDAEELKAEKKEIREKQTDKITPHDNNTNQS